MKLTKTWLSYIIWGFFSIIFFTNIGIAAIEIGIQNETTNFLMPIIILYGGTIAGILVFIGVYKLIEKYMLPKMKSDGETPVLKGPGEWLAFAMVIFIAVAVRAIAIISAGGELTGTTEFYEYAIGNADSIKFAVHNNASYVYCGFLGFLLSFLGHFPIAAMSVQAGIQIITIIVSYFAVKKAIGRLPAWIAIIMMAFLPGSFFAVRMCTPDSFLTMLFAFYMLALVHLGQANREQKIRIGAHSIFYFLIGVFAAFLTYLDWTGLLSFVIGIVALIQYKNEDAWLKIQKPFLQVLWFSIAYVLVMILLLWFLPMGGMESGPAAVMGYVNTLIPSGGLNLMIMSPHNGQWDTLVLFIFSGLWFVGFLRTKQDKAFPYVFFIVFLTTASFLGIGAYDYAWMASYLWIVLSTIGITSISDFRRTERDVAVAEKTKESNAKRKAERERKRAEAAGEKSIRLDEIHENKGKNAPDTDRPGRVGYSSARNASTSTVQLDEYNYGSVKKGYGIGLKTDTSVTDEVTNNKAITTAMEEDSTVPVAVASTFVSASIDEKYNVVKKVDRPPLGMPSSLNPVQPQYGYSAGSRSRRSLRSPSKSTFTQEDLERISRYTGVNYMASQTVSVRQDEPQILEDTNAENPVETTVSAENIEAATVNPVNVIETSIENVIQEMTVKQPEVVEETVVIRSEVPSYVSAEMSIDVFEKTITEEGNFTNTENETAAIATGEVDHSVGYIELDATQNTEDNIVVEPISVVKPTPTLAPYVSPSRRHFRHPSKSTFSPEELEKISQYTGISYKKQESLQTTNTEDNNSVPDEKQVDSHARKEELPKNVPVQSKQGSEQQEKSSVQSENVFVQSGKKVIKTEPVAKSMTLEDVKLNSERKPKMIRNPLPGPKPHVAKELSYDYNPKPSEMEFDIVDLRGKDFFDL